MKHTLLVSFLLSDLMICFLPFSAAGAGMANYFAIKGGVYSPESDDLEDFDTGFNGEIAYGFYFHPYYAVEIGLGYFETEDTLTSSDPTFGSFREDDDIKVIPFLLSLKGVYPIVGVELFGEVGVGVYFADIESDISTDFLGDFSLEDDDTALGVHLGGGINFDITPNMFFGLEGRYFWAEAEFEDEGFELDADLDGFIATVNLGFRF